MRSHRKIKRGKVRKHYTYYMMSEGTSKKVGKGSIKLAGINLKSCKINMVADDYYKKKGRSTNDLP